MIFFNKKHESVLFQIQSDLKALKDENKKLEEALSSQKSTVQAQLHELSESIETHNMSLEDLLDELNESSQSQKQLTADFNRISAENASLLKLIQELLNQKYDLTKILENQPGWKENLQMQQRALLPCLQSAQVLPIDAENEPVSFLRHEVISVVETSQPELNETVEKILTPGLLYQSSVIKKAKVIARKYRKETVENE